MKKDTVMRLFSQYGNDLYRFALSYVGSKCEAEDIVQDVFVKLIRHFGKKSEAGLSEMEGQLTIFDSFNEAEGFMQEGHSLNTSNPTSLKLPKLL